MKKITSNHKCKYCGALTTQDDEQCYANSNNKLNDAIISLRKNRQIVPINKNTKMILHSILLMILFYFVMSFIKIDFNFTHWSQRVRILYITSGTCFSIWIAYGIKNKII